MNVSYSLYHANLFCKLGVLLYFQPLVPGA